MKHVVFSGCSFTSGYGWNRDKLYQPCRDHDHLWTNLCYRNIEKFNACNYTNIGFGGASNTDIFVQSCQAIGELSTDIDTMFVQWTSYPRYNFGCKFEHKTLFENIIGRRYKFPLFARDGAEVSRRHLNKLYQQLMMLHHPHWEIVHIVRYTATLSKIANQLGITIFFVNGLCHWDKDYFVEINAESLDQLTSYTQTEILTNPAVKRKTEEYIELYKLAHQQYREAGGIDPNQWINLYDSFKANQKDRNFDNLHPGIKSNQQYFELVESRLKQLHFI